MRPPATYPTVAVWLCIYLLLLLSGCAPPPPQPGEEAFRRANSLIDSASAGTAHGNTAQARDLARMFSILSKEHQTEYFTGGKQHRIFSLTREHFLTYLQWTPRGIVVLVHVPQLKNYNGDVRSALVGLLWDIALAVIKDIPGANQTTLAVALRGALLYGGLAIGSPLDQPEITNSAPVEIERLYPFFVEANTPPAPN